MKNQFGSGVDYDVVICGGGLAGLCLARQLQLHGPAVSVLVLERQPRPLPDAAFKVGESTIEAGAFYYSSTLDLKSHLESAHLEKNGLRHFYTAPSPQFEDRPELGVRKFLPAKSHQIDRGKLETYLRQIMDASSTELIEGAIVRGIELRPENEHRVTYAAQGATRTVRARWVVDASGRRRLLQSQLRLGRPQKEIHNSAWFRVAGRLSVADFVPAEKREWHERVQDDRWLSTNHLMGRGYWVWLIPLAGDCTSIGIVAADRFHPAQDYRTFEKAMTWLTKHEPLLAEQIPRYRLMDFMFLRNYSYSSNQVFSTDRWSCIGEAATFADPYYSVGSNMIAFANGFTRQLIALDLANELTPQSVAHANGYFLNTNDALTNSIHRSYPFLDDGVIMSLKTLWDYYIGWTTTDPQLYHEIYLSPERSQVYSALIAPVIGAQARMLQLFEDWAELGTSRSLTFDFIDYVDGQPTLKALHVRVLPPRSFDFHQIVTYVREAVERIEELAHVIFFLAVRNALPDELEQLQQRPWINIRGISLHPENWERDGLFSPKTKPRDFSALQAEVLAHLREVAAPGASGAGASVHGAEHA